MGKRVVKIWDLPSSGSAAALLILSAAFLLGGLAGCFLVNQVSGGGSDALSSYLEGYLSFACSNGAVRPEALSLLWEIIRWPLLVVVLSLTPLGLLGIPILFLVRGFLLSFAIASFFHVLGAMGLTLAFVVFGITGLISVPVLFALGVQGFLSAAAMVGRLVGENRRVPLFDRMVLIRCCVCAAALCVCGFIEYCAVPVLLESLAGVVLG